MVVVNEAAESIRTILYDNWRLHSSLSKSKMGSDAFNTGTMAASRKYPSIEILPVTEEDDLLTTEWWAVRPFCHVHVHVRPKASSNKSLATAKSNRKYMVQEVKRILHNKQIELRDIDFIQLETLIYADQYHGLERPEESSEPTQRGLFPILHTIIPVRARQWHSSISGGIAVNR